MQLPERIDPLLNAWCVALAARLRTGLGASVRDAVIGYCSVTVYFNPQLVDGAWLEEEVRAIAETLGVLEPKDGAVVRCAGLLRRGVWTGPD